MKKLKLEDFIDVDIDEIERRILMWNWNVYGSSNEFHKVLKIKWKLAQLEQSGGSI